MDEFVYERKKMNKKLRKTIRLTAISLGALLTVFLLAVTIVVNFIFTPEKLTPVVLNVANQSLNARLQMKSVELTFFSTFWCLKPLMTRCGRRPIHWFLSRNVW